VTFPARSWSGAWGDSTRGGRSTGQEVSRAAPWDLLLYAVAATVLVTAWRVQDLFPLMGKLQFPMLAAMAAYAMYLFTNDRRRALRTVKHPVTTIVLAIFVLMMASVPWAVYPGRSFSFIFKDHIKTLAMMLLIAAGIRSVTDVERFVKVLVVGATLYSFIVFTRVSVGPNGRLDELWYYDANDLAMLLAATLPLMVYFVRPGASTVSRILGLGALGLATLTIIKTGSRGGFLALLASGAYMLFGFGTIPKRVRVTAVAVVGVLLMAVGSNRYWEMMSTMLHPTQDYNWSGKDDVGRMEIWKRGIGYMMDSPLVGVGVNDFPIAEGTISPLAERQDVGIGLKWSAAHNSFVQIGAELGVGGLLLFLAALYHSIRALGRIGRLGKTGGRGASEPALAQALIAALVAYCVGGFFLSQAYSPLLYAVLGMVVGLAKVVPLPTQPSVTPLSRQRRSRVA
jgi:O-antigen ligase/polysaccharide polymerase Wzy-like membrane protein